MKAFSMRAQRLKENCLCNGTWCLYKMGYLVWLSAKLPWKLLLILLFVCFFLIIPKELWLLCGSMVAELYLCGCFPGRKYTEENVERVLLCIVLEPHWMSLMRQCVFIFLFEGAAINLEDDSCEVCKMSSHYNI